MSAHAATVEVLTAEVRVLMVGSRQVTLSVARQLDHADPEAIQPFGRIRTGSVDGPGAVIEVIGAVGGVLARSFARRRKLYCQPNSNWCPEMHRLFDEGVSYENAGHHFHDWEYYTPGKSIWDEWEGLPLIVLAGLR